MTTTNPVETVFNLLSGIASAAQTNDVPVIDESQTTTYEGPSVCDEAYQLVHSDRAKQYGSFKVNAKRILDIYKAMKQTNTMDDEKDVALFLVALKLGREGTKHKRDNLIDTCGYLELLDELYDYK